MSLAYCSSARAISCSMNDSPEQVIFSIPPLAVQRDLPVGTVVWQQTVKTAGMPLPDGCSGVSDSRQITFGQESGILSGRSPVYSTRIPGIGYAIASGDEFNDVWPATRNLLEKVDELTTISFRLVVTGQVSSGVLSAGEYARRAINGQTVQQVVLQDAAPLTRIACELSSSREVVVPLGDVPRTRFTGVGSTQGDRLFQLGLLCDAGAQVNIQFDGEIDSSGIPGVLALLNTGGSGIASGIGVQMLYNQSPIKLGERLPLETAQGGLRSYSFTARYYQTKPKVTSGEANSVATFSLTYQ